MLRLSGSRERCFVRRHAFVALGALALLSPSASLHAQGPAISNEAILQKLEQQEAELATLRQQLAAQGLVPAPTSSLQQLPGPNATVQNAPGPIAPVTQTPYPATNHPASPYPNTSHAAPIMDASPRRLPGPYTAPGIQEWDTLEPGSANRVELTSAETLAAAEEAAKDAAKDAAKKDAEGGWVDLSSDKWNVKLGGHVQMDYILWPDTDNIPAQNMFEFRRLRLMADGTGYGVYDFRLQVDFEPEGGDSVTTPVVDVKDAYLTANELPVVQRWRIGNFFVPFGLEQVTNDTNNIFLERSIPTQGVFTADREVGMATYGVSEDLDTTWTFGCFFDRISESLKERVGNDQGIRLSGRYTHLLYYDEPSHGRYLIHTGAGVLFTSPYDDMTQFRARPQIHEGPFVISTPALNSDAFTNANIEFASVWGPFSVQSEAYISQVSLRDREDATLCGFYVYGSWFLTGENRIYERYGQHGAQFGRNVPYSNFFLIPGGCGPGGWEFKIRSSYLNLVETNSGTYVDTTVGFNWYWSDRTRVMFDWIHPWTSPNTLYGKNSADIIGMRFDFNW